MSFLFQDPIHHLTFCLVVLLFRLLLALAASHALFLMTLAILRNRSQECYRVSLKIFLMFSLLDWSYGFGGERPQSSSIMFHYIISISTWFIILSRWFITININLDHLAEAVVIRSLHGKVPHLSALPVLYSWGVYAPKPTLWEWRVMTTSCRARIYISCLEFSHRGRSPYAPPFIYFFNHWLMSVWTTGYFMPSVIFQNYVSFCSNCTSFGPCELFQLVLRSPWHTHFILSPLLSGTTTYSRLTSSISFMETRIRNIKSIYGSCGFQSLYS